MTTETKENGRLVRVKAFATRTMQNHSIVVVKHYAKKSAVAVVSAAKGAANVVWTWAIKPVLTFMQKWFGPIARALLQSYAMLCIAMVTSVIAMPVTNGRYAGLPLLLVLFRTGFRPEIAIR